MKGLLRKNLANLITGIGVGLTLWLNLIIWGDQPINFLFVFFLVILIAFF